MKNNKLKITIQDVAKEAGVSITTVSRVMNNNYPVSRDTREKVEKAVKKLNFNPSYLARSLIIKKTEVIGIVVPSITNMFFTTVVKGIQQICKSLGYTTLLSDSEGDGQEEMNCVKKLLSRQVDGIIIIDPNTDNMVNDYYQGIAEAIPLVFVNGCNEGLQYNFVLNDQKTGAVQALEFLIELGHRDIAFIRGHQSYSYDIKEEVYREIMKKNCFDVKDNYIINIGEGNNVETADNTMKVIYSMFREEHNITAFFACNDLMAVGALNACKKAGIKVPEEVSIVGFDNIMLSELSEPKLTTVDQNMLELGRKAADMLIDMIEHERSHSKKLVLNTRLVIRGSCCANTMPEDL